MVKIYLSPQREPAKGAGGSGMGVVSPQVIHRASTVKRGLPTAPPTFEPTPESGSVTGDFYSHLYIEESEVADVSCRASATW